MKKLLLLSIVMAFVFVSCNEGSKKEKTTTSTKKEKVKSEATQKKDIKKPVIKKGQKAVISTSYGDMTILLYDETPEHRDNFIKLVNDGFYDGTIFHRVIKDFMIQGGDPESKNAKLNQRLGTGSPGYTLPAEFDPAFYHKKGALAAARKGDNVNPQKRSSGSQFYIVQGKKYTPAELNNISRKSKAIYTPEQIQTYQTIGGTPFLDNNYTVFGEVIDGMEVIDKIATVKTAAMNRPVKDIKIKIRLIEN